MATSVSVPRVPAYVLLAAAVLGNCTFGRAEAAEPSPAPATVPAAPAAGPPAAPAVDPSPSPPPSPPATGTAAIGSDSRAPAITTEQPAPIPSDNPSSVDQSAPRETFIALPPTPEGAAAAPRRTKPLRTTVGIPPTASDLGAELEVGGPGADTAGADVLQLQNWTLNVRGYIRAPMRISMGPGDDTGQGNELHSPPRMIGFSSSNWSYIALAPNSSASLRTTISNPRVTGTVILTANTFSDVGYDDIDSLGGVSQGYVTLKFPEAFGPRGGLAWTVGAFSHSYGTAGPRQSNTGYYGTYLFGRTHVVGEDLTADIDLNDHWELLIEHGLGAKLDLLPSLAGYLPKQMFIPGDPRAPLGSNYLHHVHVALWNDNWLKIAAHYLTSWSPNERVGGPSLLGEARLSSTGVEVHVDHPRWGSGYLGYSHVWGHNLYPLDEALQVIHGGRGYDFKLQYFGNKFRQYRNSGYLNNDGGRVETVLFQYILRSWELFEYPGNRRSLNLSVYGMFSHAYSPPTLTVLDLTPAGGPALNGLYTINDNKLKYGALLELAAFRHLSLIGRFDRVQPTSSDKEQSYTALTGQLVIRSDWRSNRQVIVGYTRFLLGLHTYPDSPYSAINKQVDANLFVISAIMSL
jgi:hypothetical protein